MPLTPAHAAAAWPIHATVRLPIAALVIGTVSPDLEYLLRLAPRGQFGHTALGIAVFCVPVSLLVLAVFNQVLRPLLIHLLPREIARSLVAGTQGPKRITTSGVALTILAMVVGALSHVAWDGFTHQGGWAVVRFPVLTAMIPLPGGLGARPLYKLLQHASTIAGGLVLTIWVARVFLRVPAEARRFSPIQRTRGLTVLTAIAAAAAIGALNGLRAWGAGPARTLAFAAVGSMAAGCLGAVAIAVVLRRRIPARGTRGKDRPS
jgi:hypothetical protein